MKFYSSQIILSDDEFDLDDEGATKTLTRPKSEVKKPSMYKVIILNDDFTPMDFVIHVLMKYFRKTPTEATEIMLNVHHKGAGLCGVYPFEVAETKVHQVNSYSKLNKHPLKCVLEKE